MLILSNEDAEDLLTMPDCIAALERTYRETAAGTAVNGRRSDMITATALADAVYCLKVQGAVVPSLGVGAIRLNSDILTFPTQNGSRRKVKVPAAPGERWVGLVLLFSTRTGEPLAIFPDGVVQRLRVGATSGLAARHLARPDATVAAILGSGWQAGAQAMAAAAVRSLSEIRCFSPNPSNRQRFAADLERRLAIPTIAAPSAEQAVRGADIVLCATNSLGSVLSSAWLERGMHVGSIRDREIAPDALRAVDRVVVHHPGNMGSEHLVVANDVAYSEGTKEVASDPTLLALSNAHGLADLVSGAVPGRSTPDDITCFLNYHGLGQQFAAVGAVLYEKASAAGRGRELPTDWFTENVHP